MRLRNNPRAKEIMEEHAHVLLDPTVPFNKEEVFGNNHPVHIEIGMGKGDFIIGMAKKYPDINFIGIEKYDSVLCAALKKYDESEQVSNVRFLRFDAIDLLKFFSCHSIDLIYLNFSDPWPKNKHEKRRLTYKTFLDVYKELLILPGKLEFKTDNRGLFEFSIVSMNQYGLNFEMISLDLHKSEYNEENVMTEYERKFSPFGPIYKIICEFKGE